MWLKKKTLGGAPGKHVHCKWLPTGLAMQLRAKGTRMHQALGSALLALQNDNSNRTSNKSLS